MRDKLKEKIIKDKDVFFFTPMTKEYGWAEFICCPVFRWGKLREFYLYPAQQQNVEYYYKIKFDYPPIDFSISSWSHKGIDDPVAWLHFWCKEHKCHSFRFHVPRNSNCFTVSELSNFSIIFDYIPNDTNTK